jgi:hypothetical protein
VHWRTVSVPRIRLVFPIDLVELSIDANRPIHSATMFDLILMEGVL